MQCLTATPTVEALGFTEGILAEKPGVNTVLWTILYLPGQEHKAVTISQSVANACGDDFIHKFKILFS